MKVPEHLIWPPDTPSRVQVVVTASAPTATVSDCDVVFVKSGTAETDKDLVPFLGAEYGAGLPAMYRRRTLVSPDDIAAMLPVQLGSGVNLLGYNDKTKAQKAQMTQMEDLWLRQFKAF